jgi:ribonuclease-3
MAKKKVITRHINLKQLQARIQYAFKDAGLLAIALRHESKGLSNNGRLEALGNKILELVIVEALYKKYPDFDEGRLTGIAQRICRNYSMLDHARAIALKVYAFNLRVTKRDEALADAFQALVGAIYIDGGLDAVRVFILREFERDLNDATPARLYQDELRFFMRKNCNRDPIYEDLSTDGAKLAGHFTYAVLDDNVTLGRGQGHDPTEARTNAARVALDYLKPLYAEYPEEEDTITGEGEGR